MPFYVIGIGIKTMQSGIRRQPAFFADKLQKADF